MLALSLQQHAEAVDRDECRAYPAVGAVIERGRVGRKSSLLPAPLMGALRRLFKWILRHVLNTEDLDVTISASCFIVQNLEVCTQAGNKNLRPLRMLLIILPPLLRRR